MTRYVVLAFSDTGWRENGTIEAHSANAAVRKSVTEGGGTFVAVAASQWKPLTVEVEVKRQVRLSPLKESVDRTAQR